MRVRSGPFVAAAVAVFLAPFFGCRPHVKPGLVVTGDRLKARFDRPMVGPEALGHDVVDVPMRLEPKLPGRYRWLDARTLAFIPAQPPPRSTRFEAEVPAGTTALDGTGIAKPSRWSFETERLRVSFPARGVSPPEKWATPDQAVALAFNQPVRVRDVEKRCAYLADGGKRTDATIDGTGETAETRERFRAVPHEPLALATRYRFQCGAELTGAEGPLGILVGGGDGGPPANEVAFETYGPFAVAAVTPRGGDVSPDDNSIVVRFSNPIAANAPLPITIEPLIEGFPERAAVVDDKVSMGVRALKPSTRYTIKVAGTITDRFKQQLPGPFEATFQTGDGAPAMDVETGAWVVEQSRGGYTVWARNLTHIEADVAAVPEAKLGALSASLNWWDEEAVDLKKVGLRGVHATIPVTGRHNEWVQVAIEPSKLLGAAAAPAGFYYVALRAPEEPLPEGGSNPRVRELLLNFTNLGLTAKLAGPSGLVWVTRLSDGAPQSAVEVSIRDAKGKVRWRGVTDAEGAVVTPGRAQLNPPARRAPARRARAEEAQGGEGEGEGDEGEGGGGEAERDYTGEPTAHEMLVFARMGNDTTSVNPEREGGLAAWNFHVAPESGRGADQLRGFIHSDRGLYRPGDTVHVRGLARTMRLGGALRVPASRRARITVRDPRGEQFAARLVSISRYGGFNLDVPISEGARLGDYRVEAALAEGSFSERFSVEQYRAAAFEVKVAPPPREPVAGDELRLTADARYLYGAPLRGGTVTWRVYRRGREVSFPKLPSYEFGDARAWADNYEARSAVSEPLVSEEEQRLDANGQGQLVLRLNKDDFQSPQDLMVTAEVQDETHQTIAANVAVPAHRAGIYFGIDRGSPIGNEGGARAIKLVAVDPKGTRVAAKGTFTVVRRNWSCAYETWGYRGSYRCDKKEEEVMRQAVEIPAGAPAQVRFSPPTTGEYFIAVEGPDAAGNVNAAAADLWIWGGGVAAWRAEEGERFDIIADKPSYQVGDTAHLLLKTTLRDATGLLTVERDGILERRLIKVGPGTSAVDVGIKEGYGPNVYASVVLVKGRSGKGSRGLPVLRMGMTTLAVDVESKRLKVAVTTDRDSYRPGDPVTASLRVTDAAGKPVQAEVALSAADEGVLSLIAFKTPDPMATFYAPWGLGVATATQYERLARLPEPGEERYATGGDSGAPGTFRSRFLATAYWNPAIETDADGRAQVTFQAPDNLTAYRLMAVAADAGERFGSGDRRITVRKPLQIMSAMPRFLNVGDEIHGGVLVINDTGKPGTAVVDAQLTGGAELRKGGHQEIAVPAGGRAPVAFAVRASHAGEVRVRVKAALGAESDGLELHIPVRYPAPVETQVVAEGSTTGSVQLPVKLPAGTLPGSATLEVSTDPDGVAGLEEGLRDLIEYPYGCLEQTTSRLIPLVAVEELAKSLKLPGLDGPALQRFIRAGLGKLERFQTDEGGFSLWVGGKPEPYLTAFALWGLKMAKDAGHRVRPEMFTRGIGYLHAALGSDAKVAGPIDDMLGEMGSRAFAVHVLGLLGTPEAGYASKLLESKDGLPRFGTAFLARALALNLGAQHPAVTGLLDDLARAAQPVGAGALIREAPGHDLDWYMSSDLRTTAIATDAFLDLRPSEPMLPKLVKALLGERHGGRWNTTQDNLYALVALVNYVKHRAPAQVSVAATLGGTPVVSGDLSGKKLRIRRASVPLDVAHPPAAPLAVAATGGEVFYSALLRFRRDLASQQPYEHEITVRREYLDPATDAPVDPAAGVKAGTVVRVRLTVSSTEWRKHVAIDDPLPAGLEAVNTRFATSAAAGKRNQESESETEGEGEGCEECDDEAYWTIASRELRDDRVTVFIDGLPPGPASFDYLARATTPGAFALPGASVQEMYRPEINARTAPGKFVVTEK
jgi:uncharacterized protein YfaS (alpha-2-macroglobulin family)